MDSPVILDTASEFGRGIDLDRAFPGFPFDDVEGFGRRSSDIRSHLDDLASRHPEFADHLLGPAWGDIPSFHTGSLRNRRRGSGSSSSHHGHPDDDARSQASGSSGTSAASGASGVSSHGEKPTAASNNQQRSGNSPNSHRDTSNTRRNPIPHYGLRNTVDIGQHRHDMENPTKNDRGQRSMSAPPENRQQDDNNSNSQQSQNPNQRYVSRVDITPQFVQPQQQNPQQQQQQQPQQSFNEKSKPQQHQQPQQKSQHQPSNVRHIPIFVEGRDEPVIPKNVDQVDHETPSSWSYGKPQSHAPWQFQQPSQFQTPPKFHRPSHFNKHCGMSVDPFTNFEEEFYSPQTTFQPSPSTLPRKTQQHQQFPSRTSPIPQQSNNFRQQPHVDAKRGHEHPFHGKDPQSDRQQSHQQSHKPQEPTVEPRKQTQPKNPLDKVAEVQKEVDALTEQVNLWNGTSRKDKQYMYLDEMLTRELIKLDDIETEGKENVRQARKNAIRSIQDSIGLLESKAPLPGQPDQSQPQQRPMELSEDQGEVVNTEITETVDDKVGNNDGEREENEQQPIPLPAGPSSPVKDPTVTENFIAQEIRAQESQNTVDERTNATSQVDDQPETMMNNASLEKVASLGSMEVQTGEDDTRSTETTTTTMETALGNDDTSTTTAATMMDTDNSSKSPKVAKKVKKTKKGLGKQQTAVSEAAIALPAPENTAK